MEEMDNLGAGHGSKLVGELVLASVAVGVGQRLATAISTLHTRRFPRAISCLRAS